MRPRAIRITAENNRKNFADMCGPFLSRTGYITLPGRERAVSRCRFILVSLNVSIKRKSVKEITLGNLTVNSIHLSKCLSKIRCLSL